VKWFDWFLLVIGALVLVGVLVLVALAARG
jgi:hypothetical protein